MSGLEKFLVSLVSNIEMEGSKRKTDAFSLAFICVSLFILAWVLRGCYSKSSGQEEVRIETENLVELVVDSAVTTTEAPKQPDFWKATFDTVGVVAEQAPKFLLMIGNAFLNQPANETESIVDSHVYSVVKKPPS